MPTFTQFSINGIDYRRVTVVQADGSTTTQVLRRVPAPMKGRKSVKRRGRYRTLAGIPTVWRQVVS